MIKSDFPPRVVDGASEFDPVLHGVARGLGDLFPPIYASIEDADEGASPAKDEDEGDPANP